jgi:putative GTP pyrophosphokinase
LKDNLDLQKWYSEREHLYSELLNVAEGLLERLLYDKGIPHLRIEKRVKELKSLIEKMDKRGYDNPEQVTDLAGLRIIGFILSDTEKIEKIIEDNFEYVGGKEVKAEALEKDRVGYLSTHYIASISKNRIALPEYEKYKDLRFEIQVRTMLQHTWAVINHDRVYKSASELPSKIQREFYLLAAQLEIADYAFQRLADDVENYRQHVSIKTKEGNLEDVRIDPIAIEGYLSQKFNLREVGKEEEITDKDDIDELESQGIKSIADLDRKISKENEKYRKLTEITHTPFPKVVIADIYNSRDKKILIPRFLRALFDISYHDNKDCINEMEAYQKTGLGGYGKGIIPYVVADLEASKLIERCTNVGEIRLTEKGNIEVKKMISNNT